MLVNKIIPGLYNGVSQQLSALRLDNQAEEQVNAWGDIALGLYKRPPTELVSDAYSNWIVDLNKPPYLYAYARDSQEKYLLLIDNEDLKVIRPDGTQCTVNGLASYKQYLGTAGANPSDVFRAVTVGDTTLINNKTKIPTTDSKDSGTLTDEYIIHIDKGLVETTYKIIYNEGHVICSYTTPASATTTSHHTDSIALQLYNQLSTATEIYGSAALQQHFVVSMPLTGGPTINNVQVNSVSKVLDTDYTVSGQTVSFVTPLAEGDEVKIILNTGFTTDLKSNTIRIRNANVSITSSDTWGDQAMSSFHNQADSINELPRDCFEDTIMEITGVADDSSTSIWVKYNAGKWNEIVKPGLWNTIHKSYMPHRLVRVAENTFLFEPVMDITDGYGTREGWAKREVGDDVSVPMPSFVDAAAGIQDLFFFKNRLGFISGENIVLSRANDFFNFFPETMADILDDDPIDVAVDSNEVSLLKAAIPYSGSLILFSDRHQYKLSGTSVLSPKTASVGKIMSYGYNSEVQPVTAGPALFFTAKTGTNYSEVREYIVDDNSDSNVAATITAHVPKYIPSNVVKMSVSSTNETIFMLSTSDPGTLYVYTYYWEGDKKIQSAWHKWSFSGTIFNVEVIDNEVFLLIRRLGVLQLEKLDLEFKDVNVFLDNGSISYEMRYTLSKWNANVRGMTPGVLLSNRIRSMDVISTANSTFSVETNSRSTSISKQILPNTYFSGDTEVTNKILIMGDTKDTTISIVNNTPGGCRILGLSYEGVVSNLSTQIQ